MHNIAHTPSVVSSRLSAASYHLPDHAEPIIDVPTDKREVRSWLLYDWSNGPFFYSAVTFLPLIITAQAKAMAKTEYCGPCANNEWAMDYQNNGTCDKSIYTTNSSCVDNGHTWTADLVDAAKYVSFGGSDIGYASFPQYCTAVSVVIQLIVYITMGSFADYGKNRKNMLMINTWIGILASLALLFTGHDEAYWINGLLYIVAVVGFNFAVVFYNAYLPVLVLASPSVLEAKAKRAASIPARRYGTIEEFGAACAFLCSQHAGFIVGQNILLDGGATNMTM